MTVGVAAKLINVYFKVIFICGNYEEKDGIKYIHPPIDSILLDELYKNDKNKLYKEKWSKLSKDKYEKIIDRIKNIVKKEGLDGLWSIEKYWGGHRERIK